MTFKKVLISFNKVSHGYEDEEWDLQDFSWKLHLGDRVHITCQKPKQYEVIWRLLYRNLKPKQGVIEELHTIPTSSDKMIKSRLNLQQTMSETLQSKLFNERIWLGGKKQHVLSIMDHLQIDLPSRHTPLYHLDESDFNRFHILLFIVARVQLFIGKDLIESMDETASSVFQEWVNNLPGSLVLFGNGCSHLPIYNISIKIDSEGFVEIKNHPDQ